MRAPHQSIDFARVCHKFPHKLLNVRMAYVEPAAERASGPLARPTIIEPLTRETLDYPGFLRAPPRPRRSPFRPRFCEVSERCFKRRHESSIRRFLWIFDVRARNGFSGVATYPPMRSKELSNERARDWQIIFRFFCMLQVFENLLCLRVSFRSQNPRGDVLRDAIGLVQNHSGKVCLETFDRQALPERHDVGRAISAEDESKILAAASVSRSPALLPLIVLSLDSGMRLGETQALRRQDVR